MPVSSVSSSGDVLEEYKFGFHFSDNPGNVRPHVTLVVRPFAAPGEAEGLAGVPRNDKIHDSTPRAAVEGRQIVPQRRAIQGLVFHTRDENGRRVAFPFNVSHGS